MLGNFSWFCCRVSTFLINFFKKFFQEHYQHQTVECQVVWIQTKTKQT